MSDEHDAWDDGFDTDRHDHEEGSGRQSRHLRDLEELIQGESYLHHSLREDIRVWVLATRDGWGRLDAAFPAMLDALAEAPEVDVEAHRTAGDALVAAVAHLPHDEIDHEAYRPYFYAAVTGCTISALHVAKAAMHLAMMPRIDGRPRRGLVKAALGWLAVAVPTESINPASRQFRSAPRLRSGRLAGVAMGWLTDKPYDRPPEEVTSGADPFPRRGDQVKPSPDGGLIVIRAVGNPDTSSGGRVLDDLRPVLGVALPLTRVQAVSQVRMTLTGEFPHFGRIIDAILDDVEKHDSTWFKPVLLVGGPGTGKSRFAMLCLEELRLTPVTYNCAGVSDASLAGTARRWESTEPSVPLSRILATRTANPGVVLDEVDKASTARRNGSLLDALLGLLERQTAAAWLDPYVQAEVDLSGVCWIATANSQEEMSGPLRDRFRVFQVPAPGPEHLEQIANGLIRTAVTARGLDPTWARPLDGVELHGLMGVWRGGSIRMLSRYVQAVLDARERPHGSGGH